MILVTGGTGSFGHAFVARHYTKEPIRVLSRDEEKQRAMALRFPDVDYVIGDVRDLETVRAAMDGCFRVFHAAALKQVPPLEKAPLEAVRTNVIGTDNVCRAAHEAGAKVVTLSTDKAVEPVGVMGATKMLAEAVTSSWGFNSVRYGNIIGSRGSIIPVWREAIARGEPVRITDPEMTRFVITLDEALDLVDLAMRSEAEGAVYVCKSPAATVAQLARVIAGNHPTTIVGVRPGEKTHEHLIVPDEHAAEDWSGEHFIVIPRLPGTGLRYSSLDAPRLTDDQLITLIRIGAPA
jgi:UDP-N-acetylglucosamine 4,6-dehydratase